VGRAEGAVSPAEEGIPDKVVRIPDKVERIPDKVEHILADEFTAEAEATTAVGATTTADGAITGAATTGVGGSPSDSIAHRIMATPMGPIMIQALAAATMMRGVTGTRIHATDILTAIS